MRCKKKKRKGMRKRKKCVATTVFIRFLIRSMDPTGSQNVGITNVYQPLPVIPFNPNTLPTIPLPRPPSALVYDQFAY